jgi:hypothetical protein
VPITINFQLIGVSQRTKDGIKQALVEAFSLQPGRWHVQFIGDQRSDEWEMRVSGPSVETAQYLDGSLGQHEPDFIASALRRIIEDTAF